MLIRQVVAGQPADQGGIRANDVVVSVDGTAVEGPRDLQRIISSTPVGQSVKISLMREGKEQQVAVTVGAYQAAPRVPRRDRARARPAPAVAPASSLRTVGRVGRLAGSLALGLSLASAPSGLPPSAAVAAEVQALFPSDRQTVPDPRQVHRAPRRARAARLRRGCRGLRRDPPRQRAGRVERQPARGHPLLRTRRARQRHESQRLHPPARARAAGLADRARPARLGRRPPTRSMPAPSAPCSRRAATRWSSPRGSWTMAGSRSRRR